MRETSLRRGLFMGIVAAMLGLGALILGGIVEPIPAYSTAETVALALFIRGILALGGLGVAFALAYYAGFLCERDRLREESVAGGAAPSAPTPAPDPRRNLDPALAGAITIFCYWFLTTLYSLLIVERTPVAAASKASAAAAQQSGDPSNVVWRLLLGLALVAIGAGLGGLGGRAVTARRLLDRIAASSFAPSSALSSLPIASAPASAPPAPENVAVAAPAAGVTAEHGAADSPPHDEPSGEDDA